MARGRAGRVRRGGWIALAAAVIGLAVAGQTPRAAPPPEAAQAAALLRQGINPFPVHLARPPVAPLSAMAQLGRAVFFDPGLSASGKLACATCHVPGSHYASAALTPVMQGGADLKRPGVRAVPSLMYLERQPGFSIGPDDDENDDASPLARAAQALTGPRPRKLAGTSAASQAAPVPRGGLFWDGRADTLQQQAGGPLLNPIEMAGGSIAAVAQRLRHARYAAQMVALFGPSVFDSPGVAVAEALFAVARYQIEDGSFHPYSSKFDAWLEGKVRFSAAEARGYLLFNDPAKANCAGCHLDQPSPDGLPPRFTDAQFEALGVPRNPRLAANADPAHYDLGLCGPERTDLARDTQFCGMFLTPTLRNVATRHVFFHNGVFTTLRQVLDFYTFRDTDPALVYPRGADGRPAVFDDLPVRFQANIDHADPPFDRHAGQAPAMTAQDENDIIAFLQTLTDGYQPP
jgi:cytochrome c peroxidase